MVSFTGSTPVGQRMMELAAGTIKRVHLELGGKAPFMVFTDAAPRCRRARSGRGRADQRWPGLHGCDPGVRPASPRRGVRREGGHAEDTGASVIRPPVHGHGPPGRCATGRASHGFVQRALAAARDGRARAVVPQGDLPAGAYYQLTLAEGRAGPRVRPAGALRPGADGPARSTLRTRASRWPTTPDRPGRIGLDPDAFRAERAARDRGRHRLDQRPPPDRLRDPAWRVQAVGVRQGHGIYSLDEYTKIKHVSSDITGEVRKDWHRTIFGYC